MGTEEVVATILPNVERNFERAGGVLNDTIKPRVQEVTTQLVDLSLRELAGEDVSQKIQLADARLATLASATSTVAARAVREGVREAILGSIRAVFSLLS